MYVLICVFGTAILATLFMFNADMMSYVTDVPSSLYSLDSFLCGLCISFPVVGAASLVSIILFMIRNRKGQLASLATYICLGLLTWLVFIPVSLGLFSKFEAKETSLRVTKTSAGLFREDASGVSYYSRILENGNADGIFIDVSGLLGEGGKLSSFYDLPVTNDSAYPYSDILIKNALQPPKYVTYPIALYSSLIIVAANTNYSGFFSWLLFASLGLALLSTYGVQFFSSWRLASAFSVIASQILIVFVNYFYYMGYFPSGLRQLNARLSDFVSFENPLILLINFLIAAVLLFYGLAMGIYRYKKSGDSARRGI